MASENAPERRPKRAGSTSENGDHGPRARRGRAPVELPETRKLAVEAKPAGRAAAGTAVSVLLRTSSSSVPLGDPEAATVSARRDVVLRAPAEPEGTYSAYAPNRLAAPAKGDHVAMESPRPKDALAFPIVAS